MMQLPELGVGMAGVHRVDPDRLLDPCRVQHLVPAAADQALAVRGVPGDRLIVRAAEADLTVARPGARTTARDNVRGEWLSSDP
jgi:hypothetical protein